MTLFLVLIAALAALWAFSRAAVVVFERKWPPAGQILRVDGIDVHVQDIAARSPPPALPASTLSSSGEQGETRGPRAPSLSLDLGPRVKPEGDQPSRGERPALLLIHGASGNSREPVAALAPALGGRYRLISVDRPGHGYSTRGADEMSDPGRQADLIAATLDRLAAGPVIALGHSWGAAVAAALAERHPRRVAGLVLVAPATHPWPGSISARSRFFAVPFLGRAVAELAVAPLGLALAGPAVAAVFAPAAAPPDYARRTGTLLAVRPKTFVANARDVADLKAHLLKLSARYHHIRAPTEIVTGDADPIVSPAIHAYGLARDIPGARLTVLPGAGHMPHWSHAPEIAAAIDRVAAEVGAASRAAE